MANDNETVEQVCESVEYLCGTDGGGLEIFGEHINPISLAERILAAHEREMNALAEQKTAEAHEAFVKNAELAEAIAAKDAEIENLTKENARLRVINCGNYYADEQLRDELAAKDAEIARLRTLLKEMADALDNYPCHNCKHGSERCEWCGTVKELDALVEKAREVAK